MTYLTDDQFVRHVQTRLTTIGALKGAIDGVAGPLTLAAIDRLLPVPLARPSREPWITAGLETLGWHETRDNARLRAWLRRDGATLGDPDALPWCGDWAATAMRIALPSEPFPGPLGENPYWARNWTFLGMRLDRPMLHSVVVFERGSGGHVGFAVGEDDAHLYVLGGNQGDGVNVTRIERRRLLEDGARWPKTWPHQPRPLPRMTPGNIPVSRDEF